MPKIRANLGSIPAEALMRTAKLFRSFGEDYHERKLEEVYIFPAIKKAGGPAAGYADVLKAQHDRGREVTEYILAVTGKGGVGTGDTEPLARALESFVLMYQNHAAREDTIVFPVWKEALSETPAARDGRKVRGDRWHIIVRAVIVGADGSVPVPPNTSRGGESGRPGGHRQSGARKVKFARASPLEGDGFESSVPGIGSTG